MEGWGRFGDPGRSCAVLEPETPSGTRYKRVSAKSETEPVQEVGLSIVASKETKVSRAKGHRLPVRKKGKEANPLRQTWHNTVRTQPTGDSRMRENRSSGCNGENPGTRVYDFRMELWDTSVRTLDSEVLVSSKLEVPLKTMLRESSKGKLLAGVMRNESGLMFGIVGVQLTSENPYIDGGAGGPLEQIYEQFPMWAWLVNEDRSLCILDLEDKRVIARKVHQWPFHEWAVQALQRVIKDVCPAAELVVDEKKPA